MTTIFVIKMILSFWSLFRLVSMLSYIINELMQHMKQEDTCRHSLQIAHTRDSILYIVFFTIIIRMAVVITRVKMGRFDTILIKAIAQVATVSVDQYKKLRKYFMNDV